MVNLHLNTLMQKRLKVKIKYSVFIWRKYFVELRVTSNFNWFDVGCHISVSLNLFYSSQIICNFSFLIFLLYDYTFDRMSKYSVETKKEILKYLIYAIVYREFSIFIVSIILLK